jgi:hypothetical protein
MNCGLKPGVESKLKNCPDCPDDWYKTTVSSGVFNRATTTSGGAGQPKSACALEAAVPVATALQDYVNLT